LEETPWKCVFKSGIILYPPNTYYFDLQITFPDNIVETVLSSTWTITSDITQNG